MTYEKMLKQSSKLYNLYLEKLAWLPPIHSEEEFKQKCTLFHGKLPIKTSTDLFRRRFMSLLIYDISMMLPDIVSHYSDGHGNQNKSVLKLINDNVTKAVASVISDDGYFNIHCISLIRFILSGESTSERGEEFARISADFLDAYKKCLDDDAIIQRMTEIITFMMTEGQSHAGVHNFNNNYDLVYSGVGIQVTAKVSGMGSTLYDDFIMCNPDIRTRLDIVNDVDIVGLSCVRFFEFIFGVNMQDIIEGEAA